MNLDWETLSPDPVPQRQAAGELLQEALSGSDLLAGFIDSAANDGQPILLMVNDPHRSTQTNVALKALASFIDHRSDRAGHPPRFRAVVATGTHHFSELERSSFEGITFGDCGLKIDAVSWHKATSSGNHETIAGVRMHRWVAESRFLLPIGSVEPHYFAGVTGPHKTATIGCMAVGDIERNHIGAMSPSSDILRLQGNPVYEGIVAILDSLRDSGKSIWSIGEVICGEVLHDVAVGDPIDVVAALLPTVRRTYVRTVDRPIDVLRLRVPSPLGCNLYQADKALKNNHLAVRDGGGIILEAACSDGIGPDAFMNLLRRSNSYATACEMVQRDGYRLGDHKAVKLRHLMDPDCRGVSVALMSPHLSPSDLSDTGIEVFSDLEQAEHWLLNKIEGVKHKGLLIEDAGMVTTAPAKS